MKRRIKKKGECAHYFEGEPFLVTDDPYPIYNNEFYCKLGKFNWTWGNHSDEELPCKKCKKFKLSMTKIRKANKDGKIFRQMQKEAERYYRTHPQENDSTIICEKR